MGLGFSSLGSALLDPENEEAVRNIFKKYDKDKNGSIDKNEFMNFAFDVQEFVKIKGLQENPINLDNQKKLMSFFYFDTDNNGNV
eukprot:gene10029-2348_t